jgi:AAHS family 3-hydroxyphenylpropionic acid transporter
MSTIATPSAAQAASRSTIALCFAVAVLEGFDIQVLGVAAPRLVPELGLTPTQAGWVFSVSNLGLVLGSLVGGRVADRWGRKNTLVASTLVFAVFTLAVATIHSFAGLFTARLLAGLGFGAAMPNMMALATEVSVPGRRATTAALIFCGMPLGGGTSALLTQLIPPDVGWRVLFLVGGVLPILVSAALAAWLVETLQVARHVEAHRTESIAQALFADGRAVPTLLLWLTFLPTLLVLYVILNWLPLLMVGQGLDRSVTPRAALAFNWASVVGAIAVGTLTDRYGSRWILPLSYVGVIVALLELATAHTLPVVIACSALAGFCLLGANYAMYGVAPSHYPTHIRGTGSGAAIGVGRIGSVIGPLLAGVLLARGLEPAAVIRWMVPCAVVSGLAVIALRRYPPRH